MSRWHAYLNAAKEILSVYRGDEPFSHFLRAYFSQHKKMGSTDRRWVSQLCYSFFRLGKSLPQIPPEDRVLVGLFLCSPEPNEVLSQFRPEWNERTGLSTAEKFSLLRADPGVGPVEFTDLFPWADALSEGIDPASFAGSFFIQPDLFLRLRPGHEKNVREKLDKAGIPYRLVRDECLALPNATKLENLIDLDAEAVIQDLNSQRVGELIKLASEKQSITRLWDGCAASGGKSILAHDLLPGLQLTVSDIRENILINLQKRFHRAGIRGYKIFKADLSGSFPLVKTLDPRDRGKLDGPFPFILADLPCTGSGTWSRTPEQLYYFEEEKISTYAVLQRNILSNLVTQLLPGGYLLYSTCSVFKNENEDRVDDICNSKGLVVIRKEILKGYEQRADTLFAALLQRPL